MAENRQDTPKPSIRKFINRYAVVRDDVKETIKQVKKVKPHADRQTAQLAAFITAENNSRDQLTGFLKRKQFQLLFEKSMARVNRNGKNRQPVRLRLAISDTDDFGIVNKIHGEHIGDEVLQKSASQVQQNTRESDMVGRWGGEEYVYGLVEEGSIIANIQHPAERIRRLLGVKIPIGDKEVNSHASMGVTDYNPGESFEEVFKRADMAMRMAKLLGKDRTVVATKQGDKIIVKDLHDHVTYVYNEKDGIEYLTNTVSNTSYATEIDPTNGKPHLVEVKQAA